MIAIVGLLVGLIIGWVGCLRFEGDPVEAFRWALENQA